MTAKNKKELEDIAKQAVISSVYIEYPSQVNAFDLVMNHKEEGWSIKGFEPFDLYENYDIYSQKILLQHFFRIMFDLAVKANQI
ncbi:MAG: hypothetical protein HUJ13_11175 [Hydrogenovibrio crunogenus]|nr:hypothetical protein [Hydrogenovibrio crunogenus]